LPLIKHHREELQKRRRGFTNSQGTQEQTQFGAANQTEGGLQIPNPNDPNFAAYSIDEALEYQKTHNMRLEDFITNVANKIKFQVSAFKV